jgi:hypothetical protein
VILKEQTPVQDKGLGPMKLESYEFIKRI